MHVSRERERQKREGDVIFSQSYTCNNEVMILHISVQLSNESQIEIRGAVVFILIHITF